MLTSAEEFVRLRISGNPADYSAAASSAAPLSVWRDVVARFPEMRVWVAQNKKVPLEILRVLAGDGDPAVRTMVAMKRKLDGELFQALAADLDDGVRHALACNAKAPLNVLQRLALDASTMVSAAARERLRERS